MKTSQRTKTRHYTPPDERIQCTHNHSEGVESKYNQAFGSASQFIENPEDNGVYWLHQEYTISNIQMIKKKTNSIDQMSWILQEKNCMEKGKW